MSSNKMRGNKGKRRCAGYARTKARRQARRGIRRSVVKRRSS